MATASLVFDSREAQLDFLLERVCLALQLTRAQHDQVRQTYESIGGWLSADNSPLLAFRPVIYPQGSFRIVTTNKPWLHEEFDLDLVCQLHGCGSEPPMAVYEAVYQRMANNALYIPILERKKRCIRLNYIGNFHLDILPACPDALRGGNCVKVPDCKLEAWSPSNPIGFADCFLERCKLRAVTEGLGALMKDIRPLPDPVPSEYKYPLQRIVQLMKRNRDSFFHGNPEAARSVVLTTLAAHFYRGESSLSEGLDRIINGILSAIEACPGILAVPNPSNPDENFADSWTAESYGQFKLYIRNFRKQLDGLLAGRGLESTGETLGRLFGSNTATKAIRDLGGQTEQIRRQGGLRITKTGALTSGVAGLAIPRNNFYGRG